MGLSQEGWRRSIAKSFGEPGHVILWGILSKNPLSLQLMFLPNEPLSVVHSRSFGSQLGIFARGPESRGHYDEAFKADNAGWHRQAFATTLSPSPSPHTPPNG